MVTCCLIPTNLDSANIESVLSEEERTSWIEVQGPVNTVTKSKYETNCSGPGAGKKPAPKKRAPKKLAAAKPGIKTPAARPRAAKP